jgi:perosamine synthetase
MGNKKHFAGEYREVCRNIKRFSSKEDINTWNIDTKLIECVITQRTKAIFCVHLFGNMCNMDKLEDICKKHNIILIQDACQAIGSKYLAGKYQGFVGKNSTAAFSLFYSKTIQCGEGGIVVTDSDEVADKIRLYKGQGQTSTYWHSVVGYNYRMTNIQAAIALSQLRFFPAIKEKKTRVYNTYRNLLNHEQITFQKQEDKSSPLYWAVVIKLRNQRLCEAIKLALTANDIEFRPVFYPLHIMKPHRGGVYTGYPIVHDSRAAELHNTGIILPSYPDLSYQNIEYICNIIKSKL